MPTVLYINTDVSTYLHIYISECKRIVSLTLDLLHQRHFVSVAIGIKHDFVAKAERCFEEAAPRNLKCTIRFLLK